MIKGARNIYIGELLARLNELEKDQKLTVIGANGARATIAASVLRRADFSQADIFLGSFGAWTPAGYEASAEK